MPQITTIRVVRKRSIQPEQFGNATAEVELVGNVLEGEDYKEVARQMLVDSRALVYENIGLKLPASVVQNAAERDTPTETATAEVANDDKPKTRRGRPTGSKNKAKDETPAPVTDTNTIPDEGIPGDDTPNIRTNPENRVNPDDEIPGNDEIPGDSIPAPAETQQTEMTAEGLMTFINKSITDNKITVAQAKRMQAEMKIARVRDLNTPEKIATAKKMIDGFIAENKSAGG
jgi:hypothetical protein